MLSKEFVLILFFFSVHLFHQVAAFTCKDNITQCTDESTCCETVSGQLGCCPIPNAVCCSNRQHCCPEGFKCIHDFCTRGDPVICPDRLHQCPENQTCCKTPVANGYACCPLPNAVCCDDGQHCCPEDTICDATHQACLPTTISAVAMSLTPAKERVEDVPCSSTFSCPSGFTCCHVPSGSWGCCPLPEAVCCDDLIHCCSHGSTCGPTGCLAGSTLHPFHLQRSAKPINSVVCPGGQYECPDNTTCCKLPSGDWGCCPLPNAVCCDDQVHCCPSGYTCTLGVCSRASGPTLPWVSKQKANSVVQPFYNP